MDKLFYKHYKNFAKRMLAGDRDYFVCDMVCDTAMKVFMNGKEYKPLLTRDKVEAALKANKEKALREYYNQPTRDGGATQIVRWDTVRKNEKQIIPFNTWKPTNKIALAFDPARTNDNSIISAMDLYEDEHMGWCGEIVYCENLVDTATSKKLKLDSNRQIEAIHNLLLSFNGDNPDYEYIDCLYIDAGAGGGGMSTYADGLLSNWRDKYGITHRGLIDRTHEAYIGYERRYPDAMDKLRLISPKKYRTQMVEEFIELMDLGVIKFPYDYNGQDFLRINKGVDKDTGEEVFETYNLSQHEILALNQIDLMKNEITSIHKFSNAEKTSTTYALAKDKENRMHDDRFYTIILLAHRLYELRRGKALERQKQPQDISKILQIRAPKLY